MLNFVSPPSGLNINALVSEELSDFGFAPIFYSTLAEVDLADETDLQRQLLDTWGEAGYIARWRQMNPGLSASDEQILAAAQQAHSNLF